MNWISNYVRPRINSIFSRREVPENLWAKCDKCGTMLFHRELQDNLNVCIECGHHMPISPRERFKNLFDGGVFNCGFASGVGLYIKTLEEAKIIKINKLGSFKLDIYLDNGQVWRTVESIYKVRIKKSQEVYITKAAISGYIMKITDKKIALRVNRVR